MGLLFLMLRDISFEIKGLNTVVYGGFIVDYSIISNEILTISGNEVGSTSIILAGVHGDEKCGVDVLEETLKSVCIEAGTVMYGYGNPEAIKANKRFTEANLNRMFYDGNCDDETKKTYEYRRSDFLKMHLKKADALLDIHASTTEQSFPFVICEPNGFDVVKFLPVSEIVSGFDYVEPGGTDYFMNSINKIGICIECGYQADPNSHEVARLAILAFLKAKGHIKNDIIPNKQNYRNMFYKHYAKSDSFTLHKNFADFEILQQGDIIGIDGDITVYSPSECFILFAKNGTQVNDEVFLLGNIV